MPRVFEGKVTDGRGPFAIVVARYNNSITTNLLDGALTTLAEYGIKDNEITISWVPGAWELPVAAAPFARSNHYAAVLCLGAVIRGETTHDQYISQQVSHSLGQLAVANQKPVIFGLLTCNNLEQAINRSGGSVGNKGSECAMAALEMTHLMAQIEA